MGGGQLDWPFGAHVAEQCSLMPEGPAQSSRGKVSGQRPRQSPSTYDGGLEEDDLTLADVSQMGCLDTVTVQESQWWLDTLAWPQLHPQGKHHGSHRDKSLLAQAPWRGREVC